MNFNILSVIKFPVLLILPVKKNNHIRPGGIYLLLLLLLTGCVTQTTIQTGNSQVQLSALDHWFLKARVAINTPDDNLSANLEWQQTGRDFDFHIYGLFGATYTHITQKEDQAIIKLPKNQIFQGKNAQQLMRQHLGWDFPIDALSFWVKGLASGQTGEVITKNEQGYIQSILFRDWTVEFSRYETYSGFQMPKIIKASHAQMSLKIAVKKWNFKPLE